MSDLTRPIIGIENRMPQEVFDIMCDRITRAAPSSPGDGWEPIETAPRDPEDNWIAIGPSIILGFAPDEEGHSLGSCEGHWRPALPDGGNGRTYSAGWVSTLDPHVEPPYLRPTHWRPIPAAPSPGGDHG